jgi:hypothetical protein
MMMMMMMINSHICWIILGCFFLLKIHTKISPKINPTQSINLSQLRIHTSAEIFFLLKIPTKISPKKKPNPTQSFNLSQLHIHTSAVIIFQLKFPQKSPKEKTNPNQSFTTPSFVPKIFFILSSSLASCSSERLNALNALP